MGFRAIGRVMGVNNVTVLNWIRMLGKSVKTYVHMPMPDDARHVDVIEMDDMWHFTKKKNGHSGVGWLSIDIPKKYSLSQLEAEEKRHSKRS